MVITFELSQHLEKKGEYASMNVASAELPAGAYTTFRTYNGNCVLRLHQHVARLEESSALMNKPAALSTPTVQQALHQALTESRAQSGWHAPEARFRLTFAPPQLFISIEPFTPYPASLYVSGIKCVTVNLHRNNPHAKSTAFIASAEQVRSGLPKDVQEGLMIAEDGAVLEGLSSNFFAVSHGVLYSEEARVLMGVTRSLVLEVAQSLLPVSAHAITLPELPLVQECFITSVSREILPVVQIDDLVIGTGAPGPITQTLLQKFAAMVTHEAIALG